MRKWQAERRPVVLFKMVLIQHLYGLASLRRTAEEVSLNTVYRWFLRLGQVTNWVKLKFAAMNLKKPANWLWREKLFPFISILLCTPCARNPAYA